MNDHIGKIIVQWHQSHGRKHLPWQQNMTPYRVWVSEIMLQQTQVTTVIPYYERFMKTFPDVATLANATTESVIEHWAGLGYYQRARNLHQTSKTIHHQYQSAFPKNPEALAALPGIGKSTAHAIISLCHDLRFPILDGNVKRVLSRYYGITTAIDLSSTLKKLWSLAEISMPSENCRIYTQGIMDLGATICNKSPQCHICPLRVTCHAHRHQIQNHLPIKSPKKDRKQLSLACICYFKNNQLFLQRRDKSGIWPQLWCPVLQNQPFEPPKKEKFIILPSYRHILTHIEMTITPIVLFTIPINLPTGRWLSRQDAIQAGIPTAIKKLIVDHRLFENAQE